MRKLINTENHHITIRRKLLTGASAIALAAAISSSGAAADADRPLIWLQASGQFDQLDDSQSKWVPEFVPGYAVGPLADQYTSIQKKPSIGFDADASISFQPQDSDWSLRASMRIGKARKVSSVLATQHMTSHGKYSTHYAGSSHNNESHQILDFQVGKDVGLGAAWNADSTIRAGVRIADIRSRSDVVVSTDVPITRQTLVFNDANSRISRKFAGVGPSIAWDGSVPVAGTAQDGELAVDWTANAALLFGRQTMKQDTVSSYQGDILMYSNAGAGYHVQSKQAAQSTRSRSKNVTVPNLGASLGVSYRWPAARISLGYRADMFFNAIDGGIDARKSENRGFFGPFVSISVGVGD